MTTRVKRAEDEIAVASPHSCLSSMTLVVQRLPLCSLTAFPRLLYGDTTRLITWNASCLIHVVNRERELNLHLERP